MSMDYENELKKYDKEFQETNKKQISALSEQEKTIFDQIMKEHWVRSEQTGAIEDLNGYFDKHYSKLVKLMIPPQFIDDFRYMLDKFTKFQYSESYGRRSFRSRDYSPFLQRAFLVMAAYYLMGFRGTDINDMGKYISGKDCPFGEELNRRKSYYIDHYIIAARIDKGDTKVIEVVKEMMNSERNTEILTVSVIRAVFCCDNAELHELMCRLLVAARLSEGLRQSICENADFGTAQAFISLIKTIQENNLIRFSSVKRAVGTWTGLCRYEDPDRLAEKMLDDIPFVLESYDNAIEKIKTDDPVDIYMGLWGIGFYDVHKALQTIIGLVGVPDEKSAATTMDKIKGFFGRNKEKAESETKLFEPKEIHLLTIGYFCQNLGYPETAMRIALTVTEKYPDNYKLFSVLRGDYPYSKHIPYYGRQESPIRQELRKNKQLASVHYDILLNMYEKMPHKEEKYAPLLYPWFSASVSKSDILYCMIDCASIIEDDEKIDFICNHLTEIDTYNRCYAVSLIGEALRTPKQRETVINAVADKESDTRKTAVELLEKTGLSDSEYKTIEGFAKYKTAELRSGVIDLLKMRKDNELEESIIRMLSAKNENIRLAALDLLQYGISTYTEYDFSASKQAVAAIPSPTEREQILINELTSSAGAEQVTKENGYGLYDPKAQLAPPDFKPDISVVRNYFSISNEELNDMFRALLKIVDENSEKEYTDHWGDERILGNMGALYHVFLGMSDIQNKMPFSDLWNKYYEEVIKTPQRFYCFFHSWISYRTDEITDDARKTINDKLHSFFGDFADYNREKELGAEDERFSKNDFSYLISSVKYYIEKRFDLRMPIEVLQNFAGCLLEMNEDELWLKVKRDPRYTYHGSIDRVRFIKTVPIINNLVDDLYDRINEDFETNFRLLHALAEKIDYIGHYENVDGYWGKPDYIPVEYYIKAYRTGIIDRDIFLKSMFRIIGLSNAIIGLNVFVSNSPIRFYYNSPHESNSFVKLLAEEGKTLCEDDTIPRDSELYKIGNMFAQTIIDKVLDVELKRGDSETVFSSSIRSISAIYGLDRFIQILKALGNEALKTSYYGSQMSKKESLSHLLSVCYPTADDNSENLKELLKGSKITTDRLIEVAMFSPQWMDIIEGYLGIKGMKSGCYYFMAHTAESIDNKREAIIAKYTPLTKEELNGGCFDVKWFFEVYDILGEKTFQKLYKSAKYSSAGNKHTRARKYADAALGKMDITETENTISDKRNKDLLMALAIIPSKDKSDILQRYEFIQRFLKESKQFGAQRRASEGEACAYALKNLAVTAGYSDETRLTLSMETALVQENSSYFENNRIGDYDVRITVDNFGKAAIMIEKDGKTLKSVPAAIKKNDELLQIKEFCNKLKQQYSRTVRMFETSMEERDCFTFGELRRLSENPVTKAITENIVFISDDDKPISGLPIECGLSDQNGELHSISENTRLRVAHPFDLYKSGVWADYQKLMMTLGNSEGRKQPFRQVFRELYVKLPEEMNKDRSLMFAGNQIQTKRTVGALKNRRWIADYENGLQKIYYKDNIIASIYAEADWFSPGDIEAPTLEGVFFTDRKTGALLKIEDVPDIIYSEIMRDVDLAVSVAHAGGVDPETSHSTVEMRRVILEFNLSLFGIRNVHFEKNHAFIDGTHGKYTVHLGSGVIHKIGGHQINVLAVGGGKKSKLFLPFIDEDPKTAEIMTKVLTFAEDSKIKDPYIMDQIRS